MKKESCAILYNMRPWTQIVLVVLVAGGAALAAWFLWSPKAQAPTNTTLSNAAQTNVSSTTTQFSTNDVPDRNARFDFRLTIPSTWAADTLDQGHAIRFYAPTSATANIDADMLVWLGSTLPGSTTVTTTVDGQTVSWFDQQREAASAGWPEWRSVAHREAWVGLSGQPKTYYVFAQGPTMTSTQFQDLVASLQFGQQDVVSGTAPELN